MTDFIIEKTEQVEVEAQPVQKTYCIQYLKEVEDVKGNKVTIIDEGRTEIVTMEILEAQKARHEEFIKELDQKLAKIKEIGKGK
jgi:bacterioferritin (cytochrome b1)